MVVETRPGLLRGEGVEDGSGVRVFRGIPYAEAPIGGRRWQPPVTAESWRGTRAATDFGPACWQQLTPDTSVYTRGNLDRNEDCLYLNVWTAAEEASDSRPVMV
ncbi:MAG: carboxylesterase family protein, partial [Vicinamibacterales bacterium]